MIKPGPEASGKAGEAQLSDYTTNTSPVQLSEEGETVDTEHGRVIPGREGEAWYLDEFTRFGKVKLFAAPTAGLRDAFETNPAKLRGMS